MIGACISYDDGKYTNKTGCYDQGEHCWDNACHDGVLCLCDKESLCNSPDGPTTPVAPTTPGSGLTCLYGWWVLSRSVLSRIVKFDQIPNTTIRSQLFA